MSAIKNISLFIPHVFPTFDKKYVTEAFSEIGDVERVDFVAKQDRCGKPYNAVYIHFNELYNNHFAAKIYVDIEDNGSTKFYHDDSEYYWIVLQNTAKKHIPGERKARIDLGETNSISVKKTPEKLVLKRGEHFVPNAPKKPTYAQIISENTNPAFQPANLEAEFDKILENFAEEAEIAEIEAELEAEMTEMAELEAELEAEDENLVSIDWRYVQTIEQENAWLHGEVAQLRAALINLDLMYQAEAAKVRAFSSVETSVDL
jgi:hypothetical protein